jgi:hypothetical protein
MRHFSTARRRGSMEAATQRGTRVRHFDPQLFDLLYDPARTAHLDESRLIQSTRSVRRARFADNAFTNPCYILFYEIL